MNISVVIIEDEKIAARQLERMLSKFAELKVKAVINSVEEGIDWFSNNEHPQLVLSDIVLGDGLSFDIFEKIPTKSFFIYTTAFDQYTLKAFKLNSIDYLLKPIDKQELEDAIEKFKTFLPADIPTVSKEIKTMLTEDVPILSRVLVKIGNNLKIIQTIDISCFYSENKIVYLQTKERSYPTDYSLDELIKTLDSKKFFRINRQCIINLDFIKNIHTSPVYKVDLLIQPTDNLLVSRERVRDFKIWLEG